MDFGEFPFYEPHALVPIGSFLPCNPQIAHQADIFGLNLSLLPTTAGLIMLGVTFS
jgi:hypothetical protein